MKWVIFEQNWKCWLLELRIYLKILPVLLSQNIILLKKIMYLTGEFFYHFLYVMNRKKSAELCILNNWTGVLNTRKWIHESAAWVYSLECIQHSSEIMKNTKFSTSLRFITFFIPWVYIYHFDQIQNVNFTTTMLSFGFCR